MNERNPSGTVKLQGVKTVAPAKFPLKKSNQVIYRTRQGVAGLFYFLQNIYVSDITQCEPVSVEGPILKKMICFLKPGHKCHKLEFCYI